MELSSQWRWFQLLHLIFWLRMAIKGVGFPTNLRVPVVTCMILSTFVWLSLEGMKLVMFTTAVNLLLPDICLYNVTSGWGRPCILALSSSTVMITSLLVLSIPPRSLTKKMSSPLRLVRVYGDIVKRLILQLLVISPRIDYGSKVGNQFGVSLLTHAVQVKVNYVVKQVEHVSSHTFLFDKVGNNGLKRSLTLPGW